ncbi:hypothetical protein CGCA056_v011452 [Colletotrichum aenigma]|uniref:uncharacterized protein n=1 Tax=Colletotrichum aenigma TaxID=1215731 RepID=UPI0018721EF1|nr:uncharacterized protein CGCA056_v011452 [Colletotrichum aenigma]KAF5517905.1 hypothetical protein CGCA056_v011452 [Colletotrichum aenigma]
MSRWLLIAALYAIIDSGAHASCIWGFGGYAEPCGAQFIGADDKIWTDAVENSNSSGTYAMPGYDVSKPWPGSPMDGWKIAMAAVDFDHYQRGEAGSLLGGRATIGDDIKIIAPESLYVPSANESDHGQPMVNANTDWVFCAWRWFSPPETGKYGTAYWINSEPKGVYGSRHTCFDLDVPEECSSTKLVDNDPLLPTWGIPLQHLNGSTTWQSGYAINENTTAEEMQEMWKTVTQGYQPIVTMFGRFQNDTPYSLDFESGFAKLSCVRAAPAKGAKSNSENGDGNSSGSGSGGESGSGSDGKSGNGSGKDGSDKSVASHVTKASMFLVVSVAVAHLLF